MYGYVIPNQQELKIKEYDLYRSYYCGFCRVLRDRYGFLGQFTLSYDMTFLIMLLCDLYDHEDTVGETKCIAHPLVKHPTRINRATDYAADMNLILSYYSCLDDWQDEHKVHKRALAALLHSGANKAGVAYGKKAALIKDRLDRLHEAEAADCSDIDEVAGYFGDIMAELFAIYEDEWESTLRRVGFFLGKFIYIMDAYDDLGKDLEKGSYNPLKRAHEDKSPEDYETYVRDILTMMLAQASEAFETLPLIENVTILRNILYSGVWTRYNALQAEPSAKQDQPQDSAQ